MAQKERQLTSMLQPDFQEIFFATFAKKRGPIRYRLRADSNLRHDEVFLASLLRDALFRPGHMTCTKQTLRIPLLRERWELRHGVEMRQLARVPALLTISRVKKIEWIASHLRLQHSLGQGPVMDGADAVLPDTECEVSNFYVQTDPWASRGGDMQLCIAGSPFNWRLQISVSDPGWSVKVTDVQSGGE